MEIIKLKETKDIFYLNEIEEKWNSIIEKKPLVVAIDFMGIKQINSLLIGTFVKYLNEAKKENINLTFINVSFSVFCILSKCGLEKHFTILSEKETFNLNQYN